MFSPLGGTFFVMPVCYHPTTVLEIDDDKEFLENLEMALSKKIAVRCFDKPEAALTYIKDTYHYYPFTTRCLIESEAGIQLQFEAIRNEMYNADRFKAIFVSVTDYDMPNISGLELIKTMAFPAQVSQYAHIILTGKISDEFKRKLVDMGLNNEFIGKDDPHYIQKLLNLIESRSSKIFQWYSYIPARIVSKYKHTNPCVLFDGNFAELFNRHIQEKNICEFYLFDRQGSYVFLDKQANLSWLFVRNLEGIEATVQLAADFGAPKSVLDALKTKKMILSLYERSDFESRKKLNWDDYLLPATVFESNDKYLSFFPDLAPIATQGKVQKPCYYYAFSSHFPEHSIDTKKIVSYQQFLSGQNKSDSL